MMFPLQNLLYPPPGAHPWSHPKTIVATFLLCWLSFLVMQGTGMTLPKQILKRKDQVEWHSRVISSVHALVLCLGEYINVILAMTIRVSSKLFLHCTGSPEGVK